jgi:hypothetical protein
VHRLSFFTREFRSVSDLASITDRDFIGYVIIKDDVLDSNTPSVRVYESVVRPVDHLDHVTRGDQTWKCSISDQTLSVKGYLYAQQNGLTNSCAHVACRTVAARFHKNGDMTYREMNETIGIDPLSGECGLNSQQIVRILEAAGARCFEYNSHIHSKKISCDQPIYGSIESGFPAIVVFETKKKPTQHAIPVFGHTFNKHTWAPAAERNYFVVGEKTKYISSQSWVGAYIGHDDNCGSNFLIPEGFLHARTQCRKKGSPTKPCHMDAECVTHVIYTCPAEVEVDPIQAEVIGADYIFMMLSHFLQSDSKWESTLIDYANKNQLILRPLLVEYSEYVEHLRRVSNWDRKPIPEHIINALRQVVIPSRRIWMIEFSVPELFPTNRRKMGELLLLSDEKPGARRDFGNFLFARLPAHFAFRTATPSRRPDYWFLPSGTDGHVELYGCEDPRNMGINSHQAKNPLG